MEKSEEKKYLDPKVDIERLKAINERTRIDNNVIITQKIVNLITILAIICSVCFILHRVNKIIQTGKDICDILGLIFQSANKSQFIWILIFIVLVIIIIMLKNRVERCVEKKAIYQKKAESLDENRSSSEISKTGNDPKEKK